MPTARRTPPPPASPPIEETIPQEGIPEITERRRTPKMAKLETAVSGVYIMAGGALSTLPEQIGGARVKLIGISVARSSDEIAEAWVDLAEDDRRVLKMLESLTSFSGWGKVVGVHLMAVGTSVPGIAAAMPQPQTPQMPQQPGQPQGDLQTAMLMAEMFRMAQTQGRQDEAPQRFAEPIQQPPPMQQPQQPQEQTPRLRVQQPVTRPGRNVGMPSAADLGVSIPDAPVEFPTAGSENVRA